MMYIPECEKRKQKEDSLHINFINIFILILIIHERVGFRNLISQTNTMTKTFIIICFIFLWLEPFAQTKNKISILYTSADNGLSIPSGWLGDMGHTGKGAKLYEVKYSRQINRFFSVESGLEYSINKIETDYFPDGIMHYKESSIKMLSIPIYGDLTFWKYFYVNAGPTIDFELHHLSSESTFNQSGLGFGIGIGGRYTLKNFTVSLNPFYQKHLILQSKKGAYHENLLESGIKLGLGYNL